MIARKRKSSFSFEMNNDNCKDMKKICKGIDKELFIQHFHLNLNNNTDDVEMSPIIFEHEHNDPMPSKTYLNQTTSCPQCQAGLSGHFNHILQQSGNT